MFSYFLYPLNRLKRVKKNTILYHRQQRYFQCMNHIILKETELNCDLRDLRRFLSSGLLEILELKIL